MKRKFVYVWANTCKTYTENIFRLQKRALRRCFQSKSYLKSETLFLNSNKLSFANINKMQIAQIVFQYVHHITSLPEYIACLFKQISDVHQYSTRSLDTLCLFTQFGRTNLRKNSLKVFAPLLWNEIPIHLRQLKSIYSFNKNYKIFLQKIS